jgi:hypothetical protein
LAEARDAALTRLLVHEAVDVRRVVMMEEIRAKLNPAREGSPHDQALVEWPASGPAILGKVVAVSRQLPAISRAACRLID